MVVEIAAHRIAYVPLPKAGCTTVKHALAQVDPAFGAIARDVPHKGQALYHHVYRTRRFRADRWARYATGWHRFCVVRDPLERVMSCYTNRVVGLRELHKSPRLRRDRPDLPRDPDPDFFFSHIKAYTSLCSTVQHHLLPVHTVLGIREAVYDRVYRLEELDTCLDDLAQRTGHGGGGEVHNKSALNLSMDDLLPKTRLHLALFLADEYRDLARWYDNPFH